MEGHVYTIQKGRGFAEAATLLGSDCGGTIASDGWAPFRKFEKATRQACLGHLLRRCVEMLETAKGPAGRFPGKVKAVLKKAFVLRDLGEEPGANGSPTSFGASRVLRRQVLGDEDEALGVATGQARR